jgi:hypothetical protein
MTRIGKIHASAAAFGCALKCSSIVMGISTTGKGTTSVVPKRVAMEAALAAEVEA